MTSAPLAAVTGAEGFIGSHLVEALVAAGHRVRAMAQYNSFSSYGWLETLSEEVLAEVEIVLGDVRDPGSVRGFAEGADCVYHLAALIAIPYSYRAPHSYVDTNVTGTLNVLEAVRALGTPRLVHTSTSETYGTAQTVPITEDHPIHTQSPYAASKAGADRLADSYHASFGTPVVTLRPFNTFGPRQSMRAVIPTVIGQLAAGERVITLGDLRPTRDFTYVEDTARAFLAVGTADAGRVVGRTFNAGTGGEISVGDLVALIGKVTGTEVDVREDAERVRPAASEVMRLVADATRLRETTGWAPAHDLEQGLARTAEFFQDPANLARYKTGIYNV
ncbi:SDR family NAD(P)-dependent oxidoreductase [Streptomyces halstedii]|uniref:SDR family NAD(P)-dependent oxidoreductase n=1 Tax=Streptomyces TaxID=1883 RepID=UPI00048DA813|nr:MULTISPECIES: SDR family NAD(P)-dependent oxidoreductase [Streptomyces]MCW8219063.1 SDR family NAD(P)-dependent oxidoreductase [Streptomyces griseolus]MYY19016.1 SDR family NAD(P)-dependent oxidoreductase [Streptomyces sp. SID4912]SCD62853.1 NAD dependent epimerase/dehydratase, LLPSF_EDH_00030 family [Streptomyces sp. DpondAA-D4]SCE02521.1 NAD dependent epimerase/dehydratase, LLPSF_EDH_00030 family [Streptomyces sp. PpalLS-921]